MKEQIASDVEMVVEKPETQNESPNVPRPAVESPVRIKMSRISIRTKIRHKSVSFQIPKWLYFPSSAKTQRRRHHKSRKPRCERPRKRESLVDAKTFMEDLDAKAELGVM